MSVTCGEHGWCHAYQQCPGCIAGMGQFTGNFSQQQGVGNVSPLQLNYDKQLDRIVVLLETIKELLREIHQRR